MHVLILCIKHLVSRIPQMRVANSGNGYISLFPSLFEKLQLAAASGLRKQI